MNLVVLSFVNPLKLLHKTTDSANLNGVPRGMTAEVVNYRFVRTSAIPKTRASSSTTAQPDASSSAASPPPRPSMCAETMYISPGRVVPRRFQGDRWPT